MRALAQSSERVVEPNNREKPLNAQFRKGRWRDERAHFPTEGNRTLTLDFRRQLVIAPRDAKGPCLEIPFHKLRRVDVQEKVTYGDAKIFSTYVLRLSDGKHHLVFQEAMVTHYEAFAGSPEEFADQEHAIAVIHAIPAALGVRPALTRPDLVSSLDLRQLMTGSTA